LAWDYAKREVHLSMPGYVPDALNQFGHELPRHRQDSPYPHTPPNFGAKRKFVDTSDDSPVLDAAGKRFIQQVNGRFLFLGRAVDNTILVALRSLAAQQAAPTEETRKQAKQLLDYVATQEEAIITYRASDMVLACHSNASYLSKQGGPHNFSLCQYPMEKRYTFISHFASVSDMATNGLQVGNVIVPPKELWGEDVLSHCSTKNWFLRNVESRPASFCVWRQYSWDNEINKALSLAFPDGKWLLGAPMAPVKNSGAREEFVAGQARAVNTTSGGMRILRN
jgi:hypothetical protein